MLSSYASNLIVHILAPSIAGSCVSDCKKTCVATKNLFYRIFKFAYLDKSLACRRTGKNSLSEPINFAFSWEKDQAIWAEFEINDFIVERKRRKVLKNFVIKGSSNINFSICEKSTYGYSTSYFIDFRWIPLDFYFNEFVGGFGFSNSERVFLPIATCEDSIFVWKH